MAGAVRALEALVPALRELSVRRQFTELVALLSVQADLTQELRNQAEIRSLLAGHSFMSVPQPYPLLSTEDVLVMEFVDGIPGSGWSSVAVPPAVLARRMQHGVYTMLLQKGVFHADPHPGNIFFTRDGHILLVDFGIVGRLTEDEKWGLSSFFYACVRKDWDRAVQRFLRFFVEQDAARPPGPAFVGEFSAVLQRHFDTRRERWSTLGFVNDGRDVLRRHRLRLTTSFTQAAFMFFTGEGFVSQVDPEVDIWRNARVFADRFSPYMSDEIVERFDAGLWSARPASRKLRLRAAATLVAPTHLDRYVMPSRYPLFVARASGSRITDVDGHEMVDLSGGYGPHLLGYAHPVVVDAIKAAADRGNINALAHEAEVLFAEELVRPFRGADLAILCNSGTEAVLQALRLARAFRGRDRIAKFEGHYHGFSDHGLISSWFRFSGPARRPRPVGSPGVSHAALNDTLVLQYGDDESLASVQREADTLACVICEPMPSTLAAYDEQFLRRLRACCDECRVPLIFDEVVTGFRVAYGGIQTRVDVVPDVTCLGKVIGGGLPCGAVVGREPIIGTARTSDDPFVDLESRAFVGGTMSGNAIVCAAGQAVLSYLRQHPAIYADLNEKTEWLVGELQRTAAAAGVPFSITGTGSILSMGFGGSRARTVRAHHMGSHIKATVALAYYMRTRDVYVPELHTMMLSAAHSYTDLRIVSEAFAGSLAEMIDDGFFVF
jgi:glutamate-1-semialdehyde 2,1-aminomutase